jgi:hypothetical protein
MDPVKTLCYGIFCKVGASVAAALVEVRRIALGEYKIAYSSSGKSVASGSINGESVSFAVPGVADPAALLSLCRSTEISIKDLTDAQFEAFVYEEVTSGIRPNFGSVTP